MVDSKKRIAGAFLVGALLVTMAFLVSQKNSDAAQSGGALVVAAPPRTYIDVEDMNKDGVPDWQDMLIQTDPVVIPQASTTYTEPDTITGKFALNFFKDFARAKTFGMFGNSDEELVQEATDALLAQGVDELFTEKDIIIHPLSDTESLRSYGNKVAQIILAHPREGDSEALILQDALRYEEPERIEELKPIALSYTTMVKNLLETPVPEPYTKQHLDFINALSAVREDIRGMELIYEDPLYTLVRMKRYEDDVLGMSNALTGLFMKLYQTGNVRWVEGEPVLDLMVFPM